MRANMKLGRWDHYLSMRQGILELNREHRLLLSNDLGAIAGFRFDVGMDGYPLPPPIDDTASREAWLKDLEAVRAQSTMLARQLEANQQQDATHTEVEGWLRDLGHSLAHRSGLQPMTARVPTQAENLLTAAYRSCRHRSALMGRTRCQSSTLSGCIAS